MFKKLLIITILSLALTSLLLGGNLASASQPPVGPLDGMTPEGVPIAVLDVPAPLVGSKSIQGDTVVSIVEQELDWFLDPQIHREARVRLIEGEAGRLDSLVVYVLHENTYTFETKKIVLGEEGQVVSVDMRYVEQESDRASSDATYATCPDETIEVLLTTCEDDITSAVEGHQRVL